MVRLTSGRPLPGGVEAELSLLDEIGRAMQDASICGLGQTAASAIASAMVADFLRSAGYEVHHLGAGVPAADLTMFLRVVPADLVCFSVTQRLPEERYRELMDACRQQIPEPTVIFGGQGVDRAAAEAAGAIVVADLGQLADRVEQL